MISPTEFMRAYEAATTSHDLERTLGMIADDAVYLFSNQTSHIGKDAIWAVLEANFAAIKNEVYRIKDIRWLAASERVAACVYEFSWTGEIEGRSASGSGRGTSVLRILAKAGRWSMSTSAAAG